MESQQTQQFAKYANAFLRYRTLIFITVMVAMIAGLGYYLAQHKSYRSDALISYQQQSVSPARMSPDAQDEIEDIVSTLTQIVLSRTVLEQIIRDENLYPETRAVMAMEDVIGIMRGNIAIDQPRRSDTFRISFTGGDPEQVARVTNALAAQFIEENLKYRQERASETSAYTKDELEMAKDVLDQKEAVMRDYKLKYYNKMPDQLENNMRRLTALQEQYQNRQDSIQDLERTRVLLMDQISIRKEILAENERLRIQQFDSAETGSRVTEPQVSRLQRLQIQLQLLKEKYTENHPQVRKVNRQIEMIIANSGEESGGSPETSGDSGQNRALLNEELLNMQSQVKNIGISIKRLEQEKQDLQTAVEKYEKWSAATPVREAEWAALTREYAELKRHYDYLVSQNLQARSALNLERKQRGSQFKIEDPARVPEKPVSPNFMKIIAMALLAGCAVGGVLTFGLDFVDTSFRNPQELEGVVDAEILCTVPHVALKKEIIKQRVSATGTVLFYTVCIGLVGYIFFYFWQQGRIVV